METTSAGLKCQNINFRKSALHCIRAYLALSSWQSRVFHPYSLCPHPPIVLAMRHVPLGRSQSLHSPDWATTWDCSGTQSGEMLGNSISQRERRRESRMAPWRQSQWPHWVQNMQRSPGFYWPRAKSDWHQTTITLDSGVAGGDTLFICRQINVKQTVLNFKHAFSRKQSVM